MAQDVGVFFKDMLCWLALSVNFNQTVFKSHNIVKVCHRYGDLKQNLRQIGDLRNS